MTPDEVIVAITSLLAIAFTYWFFLMKKQNQPVQATGAIDIKVDGGYQPDFISVPKGVETTLNFHRTDPSTCLEEVVLTDFKIRKYLPLNKTTSIKINPQSVGEFPFSCGMNMFHGKLKVV